ncbi:MAG TPA: PD-(D/E)XK nuclease family protein [Thermodesulfovibrionales bacterium]|nr:PD-(D/E)XK nuclease family protein [Thermodesulfovibrionales bacterium]
MINTLIIGSRENLIERTATLIKSIDTDYSRNLVVFPGRRPALFLRRELAQREESSFIPPSILSIDDFVDYVTEAVRPLKKIETVDAIAILYQIHKNAPEPLGGENFLSLDSFFSLGIKLYADIEELYIEGVPTVMVKQIQPFADEMIPEHALARLQSLHFFYKTFYEKISQMGMTTRSMRYRTAAEKVFEGGLERFERVIFAGFCALTRCEKDIFRKLLPSDKNMFIFQDGPGIGEQLAELGIENRNVPRPGPDPQIHFYSSPDTHGQVFALGSILAEKSGKQNISDERTTIVLPSSETLFPLLRQGMTYLDKNDFNVSLGYPLHRTPVFGFLNNLMELIGSMKDNRIYVPDYIRFVLHPYTKNIYCGGNAEITRIIFHSIEEILQRSRTRTFVTLSEIENDDRILSIIADKLRQEEEGITKKEVRAHLRMIHLNTIETFFSFRDIGDFAAKCTELLTFIFNNSTARLHPIFYPFSDACIRALDTASKSLMKDMSFTEKTGYFTFLRKYIMTGYVPFPGTPLKGIQVLGFLETRNIGFDNVFILDANEGIMPDTAKEDTLLPLKAREILKLPTYLDKDRLFAYNFETLIRGAKEVHIFFIENDAKERSRFVESLIWEKQKRDRSTKTNDYVRPVQYKVKLGNEPPADIAKTAEVVAFLKNFKYSATALDSYLKCRLQFYYGYILGLGRKEEITGDIERADIGKFVHRVLSSYFSYKTNGILKEADMDLEEMDNLIDNLFDREYGDNPTGAVYLLKLQIKKHLRDYLNNYCIPLINENKVTIIGVEVPVEATVDSHILKGRLDMVEKRDHLTYILDYKSGSYEKDLRINFDRLDPDNRDSWDNAIGSLQLPFYLLLYSEHYGIGIGDLRGMFLLLGKSSIDKEIELPLFDEDDGYANFDKLKTVLLGLLKEIVEPDVPFTAASDRKNSCPKCDFQHICGTQWVTR